MFFKQLTLITTDNDLGTFSGGGMSWAHLRLSSLPPDSEQGTWLFAVGSELIRLEVCLTSGPGTPSTLPLKVVIAGLLTAQLSEFFMLPEP